MNISRAVDFDGNGKTVTFSNTGRRANVVVTANGTHIHDITIENTANNEEWTGTYCLQLYNGTYSIENVKATGGNAGIIVNGSTVTVGEGVDVSGNAFGGIEVSKGANEGLSDALLIVNSKITNTTEAYGKPTVWTDGEGASVTDNTGMFTNDTVKEGQVQYYLEESNSTE